MTPIMLNVIEFTMKFGMIENHAILTFLKIPDNFFNFTFWY